MVTVCTAFLEGSSSVLASIFNSSQLPVTLASGGLTYYYDLHGHLHSNVHMYTYTHKFFSIVCVCVRACLSLDVIIVFTTTRKLR